MPRRYTTQQVTAMRNRVGGAARVSGYTIPQPPAEWDTDACQHLAWRAGYANGYCRTTGRITVPVEHVHAFIAGYEAGNTERNKQ